MIECREHALLMPEPYGVWGGLTAAERRVVLARRRRRELELQKAARAADTIAAAG
jgi:WhiB family redox-sensing transcriptional regulator